MGNSCSFLDVHIVFGIKQGGQPINTQWEQKLYTYIIGITQNLGQKTLAIGGIEDHIHLFICLKATMPVPEFVRKIKGSSSWWINKHQCTPSRFEWQRGYAAFSHSFSHRPKIIHYIKNQKKKHANISYEQEYKTLLQLHNRPFKKEYLN